MPCEDNFPQVDTLNSVRYSFEPSSLNTFDTIPFRTENLFFLFSVRSGKHTMFSIACRKTKR